jgi:taurine transport system substrate-binding protein
MNKQCKALIAGLCMSVLPSVAIADKPETVTVGFLNLVNAQLVTKSLGLVQKEMPGV